MDKSIVFLASSGRTLVLAEKLRDQLATDFCQAILWSEEGRLQPGATTIIEMLESAAQKYDFAVIILAKDDVLTLGDRQASKARDNCVFEVGLFMSAIGRKRCFLVNSVSPSELPSDLGGIISIQFDEPANLQDRIACGNAVQKVASHLKDVVQRDGPLPKGSLNKPPFKEFTQVVKDAVCTHQKLIVECALGASRILGAFETAHSLDEIRTHIFDLHDHFLDKLEFAFRESVKCLHKYYELDDRRSPRIILKALRRRDKYVIDHFRSIGEPLDEKYAFPVDCNTAFLRVTKDRFY